jgi:hypothetical protein
MPRVIDALREWLRIRSRVREEQQFHLELAAADFRALGLTPNPAKRAARSRFGYHRNVRLARRELGGDLPGLISILAANGVTASPWFQPNALLAAAFLILLLSPAPRSVIEGVAGRPLVAADRNAVFISVQQPNLSFVGISGSDFATISSLPSITGLQRYRAIHSRAQIAKGSTVAHVESEVRDRTRNPRLRVVPLFERKSIIMGPAKTAWGLIALSSVLLLLMHAACMPHAYRWFLYGMTTGCLHALASMMAWALGVQVWSAAPWSTDGHALLVFLALLTVYLGATALQWRYWWNDLHRRCPVCLDGLVLPLADGTPDRVLLDPATTESVCAHGHGVLVENRWSRRFRPEESPLEGLIRA